jgi:threonylcarbamoyladenosine tRNA methylthiotransferase MtaB
MRRPYKIACVEKAAVILCSVKDDPFLACDIIAGFPGESAAFFEETYDLCKRIGFAWIHAFPYSPRPGTEAYAFSGKVSEREVSARVERLLGLAREGRRAYIGRQIGKTTAAIVERLEAGADGGAPDNEAAAWVPAVSENYLKLRVMLPSGASAGETVAPGRLVRCRIAGKAAEEGGLSGEEGFDADAEIWPEPD